MWLKRRSCIYTKISFTLKEGVLTTLAVFNLLGEKVATVVNKKLNSDKHSFDFDASNFSSGVYFYRVESGNNIATMKMMLLK